ncbi:hypothetical protein LCGC14_0770890 [marine sediment metagenome]|uniref:Uncharacterized protein n=1 Tax=marine sediment metagenome TaxID=412755 RepID=A0A0F9SID0_9ZZZZ
MELINRIKSPTPDFFNKIKWIAGVLIVIAGALLGASAAGQLELSETIKEICTYVVIVGSAIFGTAQTAKK